MTVPPARRLKTLVMMIIIICASPVGYTFVSKGMKEIVWQGWSLPGLLHFFVEAFTNWTIWLGIGLLLAFFVAFLVVLSWADYSFVQPSASLSYLIIAILARYFLHETVTPLRWAGVLVVCSGVFIVGQTHVRSHEDHHP
jgi:drug/metabolite transporter (DMT)-like permease